MTFLMFQIFMSLLIAATIGAGAVWLLRRDSEQRRESIIQREWRERVRQVELDRDRTVRRLTGELEALKHRPDSDAEAASEYDSLVAGLEERVSEREAVITELRAEVRSLRENLQASEETVVELRAQHERDLLAIQAEQQQDIKVREEESSERDSRIWQLESDAVARERKLVKLRQQLAATTDEAGSDAARAELLAEREAQIQQLEAEISTRDANIEQLQMQIEKAASDKAAAAGQAAQHASRVNEMEAEIATRDETVAGLQQQLEAARREVPDDDRTREQEQRIADLEAEIAARDETVTGLQQQLEATRQEAADGDRTHEQDKRIGDLESVIDARDNTITRLRRELNAMQRESAPHPQSSGADTTIRELEAALRQRDDSIAVLRDDIAELTGGQTPAARGRQDEQLRAAIAESEELQNKYHSVSERLAQREVELEAMRQDLETASGISQQPSAGNRRRKRKKADPTRARSAGERIAAVITSPDAGHRDNLQEIRGIGPALEKTLNEIGIYHFHQVAAFDAGDIGRVAREIGRFGNRIERDDWVGQAQELHRKYHGG